MDPAHIVTLIEKRRAQRDLIVSRSTLRAWTTATLRVGLRVAFVKAVHVGRMEAILRVAIFAEQRGFLVLVVKVQGEYLATAFADGIGKDGYRIGTRAVH